ncbi:metal dependent phosphohydrolase [Thermaerobacter marianensis DSM 12885]|uniref:Ribonuclease Y n=1 Tax=Thermaerobacter marianensis (strain ATCC 700841 / DSM 12885 / JCM 10246 / 7p75a) TaxID=644966 RepID=E6SK38_THEM7|nr:ribonuclease Y [Thermaerobacter marianensis]ADU51179.1 metal dependent phosphohydrolase [Thermaerobacter marianensis DSM 12885]
MVSTVVVVLIVLVTIVIAGAAGYVIRKLVAESRIGSAESLARQLIEEGRKEGEARKREALLEAKEEVHRLRTEFERESRERRQELQQLERRLLQREEALERRARQLDEREELMRVRERDLDRAEELVEELRLRQMTELERIAGLSRDEARELLMNQVQQEMRHDLAVMIRQMEEEARAEADRRAREIIANAVQRLAAEYVPELTVSVVELPGDEMKGRIIGREGRNIRHFEALTGVDLIIDDTPEAVVISCFDPIRREIARITLEKLIADGRIHPAKIEEMYAKAVQEMEERIREEGERACYEVGVHNLHPELVKLLGRLAFRTSYGQNILQHSIEVAHLCGLMAYELGADVNVARRAGLLHDIGKALDHEMEGTHLTIGMELLQKYHESEEVIHAMSCHHGDFEAKTIEAVIVTAADALSAARPGARRETLEAYIRRLRQLEEIASSFPGVAKAYAIQAGREVRIMVHPDQVDDAEAYLLARQIAKRIEQELQYPGQIKVTLIRETRVTEYAR